MRATLTRKLTALRHEVAVAKSSDPLAAETGATAKTIAEVAAMPMSCSSLFR